MVPKPVTSQRSHARIHLPAPSQVLKTYVGKSAKISVVADASPRFAALSTADLFRLNRFCAHNMRKH